MKRLGFTAILTLYVFCSIGQLQKARQAFDTKQYSDAVALYAKVYEKSNEPEVKAECEQKMAAAYFYAKNYAEAATWFEKACNNTSSADELFVRYAQSLLYLGKTQEAKEVILKRFTAKPGNKEAKQILEQCSRIEQTADNSYYVAFNEDALNSSENDFAPSLINGKLYFTSSRKQKDDEIYKVTGQGFEQFWYSNYNIAKKVWDEPEKLGTPINSRFNNGVATLDPTRNIVYFMQCNGYKGKNKNCAIYSSRLNYETGQFSEPEIFAPTQMDASTGHPAVSTDGKLMVFVSDRADGVGGTDLWYIRQNNAMQWSAPENLGKTINTAGNEMFPYLLGDSLLFFASDGHNGFGGLDIYISRITGNSFGTPQNLGLPFNSTADDFGILFFDRDSGLFSSNRSGGRGGDDLYFFYKIKPQLTLKGRVKDKINAMPVADAIITLKSGGQNIDSTVCSSNGSYSIRLEKDKTYEITAHKYGYLADSRTINTTGILDTMDIRKLKSKSIKGKVEIEVNFNLDIDLIKVTQEEITINDIYYDFDKWELREDSKKELDKLVNILNLNPNVKILINSHTDERGKDDYNLELSENRAMSVVEYLKAKGIKSERLAYKGWGESKPLVKNATTEEDHQKNRRTSFNVVNINEVKTEYEEAKFEERKKKIEESERKKTEKQKNFQDVFQPDMVWFKIQVGAGRNPLSDEYLSKLESAFEDLLIEKQKSADGFYKYYAGFFKTYEEAVEVLERFKKAGFSAFLVAFKDGEPIDVGTAKKLQKK